jgi:hypothetical protein
MLFYILHFIVICKSINNLLFTLSSKVSFLYIHLTSFLHPEDGRLKFLRSVGTHLPHSGCHKPERHRKFHRFAYLNSSVSVYASFIHSLCRLSYDKSVAFSKGRSPYSMIYCFFFQFPLCSRFLKDIRYLLTSSSSSSRHFFLIFFLQ